MKRNGRMGRDRFVVVRRDWFAKLRRHRGREAVGFNRIFRVINLGAMAALAWESRSPGLGESIQWRRYSCGVEVVIDNLEGCIISFAAHFDKDD